MIVKKVVWVSVSRLVCEVELKEVREMIIVWHQLSRCSLNYVYALGGWRGLKR